MSSELHVGDLVLVKKEPTIKRDGPSRFQSRVYPETYKIAKKVGRLTFEVVSITDPTDGVPFLNPLHAERLVKLDMPELELDPRQSRLVEVYDSSTESWTRYRIEKYAIDGRVMMRDVANPPLVDWHDLSELRYCEFVDLWVCFGRLCLG